jgi:hypothetical protein
MEKFFLYTFIISITGLFFAYLNKKAKSAVAPLEEDYFELRLHKLYWYMGVVSIVLGVMAFVLVMITSEEKNGWIFGLLLFSIFVGLGIPSATWYANHRFNFDAKKLVVTNVYGNKTIMKWSEIESIRFNAMAGTLVFTDKNKQKIKAHQHLVGFETILIMMESTTKWRRKDLKLPFK